MDAKLLSGTAKRLLKNNTGYRNETISGGEFFLHDVLNYEIEELGNTDIFQTVNLLYGIKFNTHYDIAYWATNMLNSSVAYGLWLTSKQGVKQWYSYDGSKTMTEYKLPDRYIILSDLNSEGVLFAIPCSKIFLNHKVVKI